MNSNKKQPDEEIMKKEETNYEKIEIQDESNKIEDIYKFGWSNYSEITNGRFAMIGFLAIILIELISQKSFLNWAGIF